MSTDTTTATARAIQEWQDHWRGFYDLSGDADCASPDRNRSHPDGPSAGAALLDSVRDATFEAVEYAEPTDVADLDRLDDGGALHQIADDAPDVYTHQRWSEFVDLAGYNEDLSDFGEPLADDLTRTVAGFALYQIAARLVAAMIADLRERFENADDEDDADDADEDA